MTAKDIITIGVYGSLLGPLVGFVLAGPVYGLFEYALSFLISCVAYFAGTSLVGLFSDTSIKLDSTFRKAMWCWVLLGAAILTSVCVFYSLFILKTRTSYPPSWLALHFLVIFITGTLVRVITFCADLAIRSRTRAVERAKKSAVERARRLENTRSAHAGGKRG